jgi:hypothetical protein
MWRVVAMSASPYRPNTLPRNFATIPASYPSGLFRLQLSAARHYLFDGELKEVMDVASLPSDLLNPTGPEARLSVAQIAIFIQTFKSITGEDRAVEYGREAFTKAAPLMARGSNGNPLLRAASDKNKLAARIRDGMTGFNKQCGANVTVKLVGDEDPEIFEDTGQHCYGFRAGTPCCQTFSGFLEAAIGHLVGIRIELTERECMATGAVACRWHCRLI